MLQRLKSFTLKEKDFHSGKMVSPPREFWKKCDCCGKPIVQGVVLNNGDHIGNDCENYRWRVEGDGCRIKEIDGLSVFYSVLPKAKKYLIKHYSAA